MLRAIAMIVFCFLLFVACNTVQRSFSIDPPQDVKDAAIKAINESMICKLAAKGCKDIKVICSNGVELGAADKANGITGKWCMKIGFIYGDQNNWNDRVSDIVFSNKRGTWDAQFLVSQFKCTCGTR